MSQDVRRRRIELVVAITISMAGLATSWASYQAGLWNGRQAYHYSLAGSYRTRATAAALDASVSRAIDVSLFSNWLTARAAGDQRLSAFYEKRFPPVLKGAFEQWAASDPLRNPAAPSGPFAVPSYRQPEALRAKDLERRADSEFLEGQGANRTSDAFTRAAVLLSMAMFFGGVGQVFRGRVAQAGLLAIAIAALSLGLFQMLSLPRATFG